MQVLLRFVPVALAASLAFGCVDLSEPTGDDTGNTAGSGNLGVHQGLLEGDQVITNALADGPAPVDAGDEAFVKRIIPMMWGRHALSVTEVDALVQVVKQLGREGTVRAMAESEEYLIRWEQWLRDALGVSRIGYYANAGCYGNTSQPEVYPDLAQFVREQPPTAEYPARWTMRDLMRSALRADDLSPVYTTHLVAKLARALNDQNFLAAFGQRRDRVEEFLRNYLNRRLACMGCHNSEFAVTDNPDPDLDRHWPVAGQFERALFGSAGGRELDDMTPFFRRHGFAVGVFYAKDPRLDSLCPMGMCQVDVELTPEELVGAMYPWGWDKSCRRFYAAENAWADDAEGVKAFFITDRAENASAWDLQSALRSGFEKLRKSGLALEDDGAVDAELGFAWLVSMNLADQVWKAAYGSRLTIVNYFPRNQWQRDQLRALSEVFVTGGFSLLDTIVATVTHPYFNGRPPAEGDDPMPYRPVFDPFVDDSIPPGERRNALDHVLHRASARTLLRSAYQAMGWPEMPEFLIFFLEPSAVRQRDVGIFHKSAQPGFDGISFQAALSWESFLGVCENQAVAPECPLEPIFELPEGQLRDSTICELCAGRDAVCGWDPRCCDVSWDAICTEECGASEKIFIDEWPQMQQPSGRDFIDEVVDAARQNGATLEDAVLALKDRLLTQPALVSDGERAALEGIMGASLSSDAATDPELDARLRRACGVFLASPQFMLSGWAGRDVLADGVPRLQVEQTRFASVCETLNVEMFGGKASCTEDAIDVDGVFAR